MKIKNNNDRFYSLNNYLKEKFGCKIYKVSLDGGFTCPNRDGKISHKGCLFCSDRGSGEFTGERGKSISSQIDEQLEFIKNKNSDNNVIAYFHDRGSGEFTGERGKSISSQIDEQLEFIKNKNSDNNVIAYFQNFTNTYAPVEYLRKVYYEALSHKKIIGIAIATRPDCLNDEVLDLLSEINEKFFLWIELGLQTAKDNIADVINRGYKTECYIEACKKLNERNIKFVTHMIAGLPFEEKENLFETIDLINNVKSWGIKIHLLYILKNSRLEKYYYLINNVKSWGIKIHLLYILKNSRLEKYYYEHPFKIYEKDEYTDTVAELIERLNPEIVIHRLTGDAKKDDLAMPLWSADKRSVLNEIQKKLKLKNTFQGKEYKK